MKKTEILKCTFLAGIIAATGASINYEDPLGSSPEKVSPFGTESGQVSIASPANEQDFARLRSIVITSAVTEGGLSGVSVRTVNALTGNYREESTLGIKSEAEGFDGHVSWSEDSGSRVRREEGVFAQTSANNQAYRNCMAYWFPSRFSAAIHALGQKNEGARVFDVLSVQPQNGRPFELWFDAATHLLVRSIEMGFYKKFTTDYSNFKLVQSLLLPFSTKVSSGDARFDRLEEVQGIQVNPMLDPKSFMVPNEGAPDFTVSGEFPLTISFRLISNLVILDAVVNGRTMPFILDTGGINLLFPETIKELGLVSEGQLSGFGGGNNEITTSQVKVDSLELASVFYRPQIVMVYPFPALRIATGLPNLAGILGYEIFKRFVVRIDYPHRQITFSLPATYQYTGNGTIIPFHFVKNAIEVDGAINSISSRVIIDTGTTGSLILYSPWVNSHRDLFPNAFEKTYTATGATGGNAQFAFAAVKSVSLGNSTFHNIYGALSLQTVGATANPYGDGMVGAELFLKSAIIFDYSQQRMIIEDGQTPPSK